MRNPLPSALALLVPLLVSLPAPPLRASDDPGPVMTACVSENVAGVRAALEAGADPDESYGASGMTCLHVAALKGNAELARVLLEGGANKHAAFRLENGGTTTAEQIARAKHHDTLADEIRDYAPRRGGDTGGQKLLVACAEFDTAKVKALLRAGADPNATAEKGMTCLMIAAFKGDDEMARALLGAGADPFMKFDGQSTAAEIADAKGNESTAALIRGWGRAGNRGGDGGGARLLAACKAGETEQVKRLLDSGADPNAADGEGITCLIAAAFMGDNAMARALLEAGADPSIRFQGKADAAQIADAKGNGSTAALIRGWGRAGAARPADATADAEPPRGGRTETNKIAIRTYELQNGGLVMTSTKPFELKTFILGEFFVDLRPCGQENAFYSLDSGNLTVCTELVEQFERDQTKGALLGVIAHELGHKMIHEWELPGEGSEDMADEMGAAMLHLDNASSAFMDTVAFWNNECKHFDPARQDKNHDDRHFNPCQRARNFREWAGQRDSMLRRHGKLLYDHMSSAYLLDLLAAHDQAWVDRNAVTRILRERGIDTAAARKPRAGGAQSLAAEAVSTQVSGRRPGAAPLIAACKAGNLAAVKKTLAAGADPDARESAGGATCLMLGAFSGNTELVKTMLAAGARRDLATAAGANAEGIADSMGRPELAALIRDWKPTAAAGVVKE